MTVVPAQRIDLREVGERVEKVFTHLDAIADDSDRERAEEAVRQLADLYGTGLDRIVSLLPPSAVQELASDGLVAGLLILHDLHPVPLEDRVLAALEKVRPYLGSHAGGVEFLGISDEDVVLLRLQGSCDGCASSTLTVKTAIETAIADVAPEVAGVEVEGMVPEVAPNGRSLLQMAPALPAAPPARRPEWREVTPAAADVAAVAVDGFALVLIRNEFAYADRCPRCTGGLADGTLEGDALTCASCGARFDVRLAGRALDGEDHLDPVPLLTGGGTIRISVPDAVVGMRA